jgi:two-component system, chemotaxis family, protein-glutamate methylesterase/glutaminase
VIKLLIVDDSPLMRRLLGGVFGEDAGFKVEFARDGVEALQKLHAFQPDVITLDVQMPHMDGLACLSRIMLERPCPVVMVSSLTEEGSSATLEAIDAGAVDFIAKPTGAVSLAMEEFAPLLRETVISASTAKVSRTAGLVERVRHRRTQERQSTTRASRDVPSKPVVVRSPTQLDAVVLVGCSTGGPPALDALLAPLPADFPWPIVVAQHMPATFTRTLARRLDMACALTVREASRTEPLVPGTVLIAMGGADLIFTRRAGNIVVTSVPASINYRWHPSVDRLIASAMQHIDTSRLIGVLMTGMGDDGASTMEQLLRSGGRTIAQDQETAVVWGMPGDLVRRGGAGSVLPLREIPTTLTDWAS